MSGQDAVRQLRERRSPAGTGGGGSDRWFLLIVVLAFVGGSGAVFGTTLLMASAPAVLPPVQTEIALAPIDMDRSALTEAELATCKRAGDAVKKAERAAKKKDEEQGGLGMNSGTGGIGALGAQLTCEARTRPGRLCDPMERAAFVARVHQYVKKFDFAADIFNLTLSSPGLNMITAPDGGPHLGAVIIKDVTNQGSSRIAAVHKKVSTALQELAAGGLLSESDFGAFLGFGAPATVEAMLSGVAVVENRCAA